MLGKKKYLKLVPGCFLVTGEARFWLERLMKEPPATLAEFGRECIGRGTGRLSASLGAFESHFIWHNHPRSYR